MTEQICKNIRHSLGLVIFLAFLPVVVVITTVRAAPPMGAAEPADSQVKSQVQAESNLLPVTVPTLTVECVDCPRRFSITNRSLQLDASGHPHFVYGDDHLYHAYHDGIAWHYETVDNATRVGLLASLALKGSYAYISYIDQIARVLKYAYQDASGWHTETVDVNSDSFWTDMTSIALDNADRPHIAYTYKGGVNHAYRDASGWHIQNAYQSSGSCGRYVSLAMDRDDDAHISHYCIWNPQGVLLYTYQDETGWHSQVIDNNLHAFGGYTSLALGPGGQPHISYHDANGQRLKYAYSDQTGWHFEIVESGSSVGRYASLVVDGAGVPHISYSRFNWGADLGYAYRVGENNWHLEAVQNTWALWGTSLSLDQNRFAHIAYFDNSSKNLMYARRNDSGWHLVAVDRSSEVGRVNSLALDASANPHVSYNDSLYEELKYAHKDAAGWYTRTVGKSDQAGGFNSLALDRDGHPHISYYDGDHYSLNYAYLDASGWHTQTVDSNIGAIQNYNSLALDSSGYGYIAYTDARNSDLRYAYQDVSGWHTQTVDSIGNVGTYPSLALDEQGYAHISYCDESHTALKYAYRTASGWHTPTIDAPIGWTCAPSLALDKQGNAYISYYNDYYGKKDLIYTFQTASGWFSQTVDSVGDVGNSSSLALDVQGFPHVSYYSADTYALRYAYQDEMGWHTRTVQENLGYKVVSSIKVDLCGYPHITYSDEFNGDLLYAYLPGCTQSAVDPAQGGNLVYTDTMSNTTSIQVPAEAVTQPISLLYTPLVTVTQPGGWRFAGNAFELKAFLDGDNLPGYTFQKPVTVTLHYSAAEVIGISEDTLILQTWDGSAWVDAACGLYQRHPDQNWLAVPICHLSRFALLGRAEETKIHLPLVLRKP